MRLKLGIGSKATKLLTTSSLKEKVLSGKDSVGQLESERETIDNGRDSKSTDLGSKDEAFFDSQTWLDSDCEDDFDDFVSVNGDLVPSRGSTPDYQISANGTLQLDKIFSANSEIKSGPTPADGKKRLAELLQESQVEELGIVHTVAKNKRKINGKPDICKVETGHLSNGANGLPGTYCPCTNDGTPSTELNHQKERKMKSKHCCFPSLARSLSFRERRNRKT